MGWVILQLVLVFDPEAYAAVPEVITNLIATIAIINNCCNPYIYGIMSRPLRLSLVRMCNCKKRGIGVESSVITDPLQAGCNMANAAERYESRHDVSAVAVPDQESDKQSSRSNGEDSTCTDERL
jgi:hypothetical protein